MQKLINKLLEFDEDLYKNVAENAIFYKNKEFRFLYYEEIKGNDRSGVLTYVMCNPSVAGQTGNSDPTVDRLRKWTTNYKSADGKKYKYFAVINTCPSVSTKPKDMKDEFNDKNFEFIKYYDKNNDDKIYVLAYGNNAKSSNVEKVRTLLSGKIGSFYPKLSNDKRPYHPLARIKVYDENGSLNWYSIEELENIVK